MRARARRRRCSSSPGRVQGAAGALLVPGSLAIIGASFHDADRGRAIGAWSGLAGVASAVGPFLGGWLIDAFSWRLGLPHQRPARGHRRRRSPCGTCPRSRAGTDQPLDVVGRGRWPRSALAALCWALDRERQRRRRRRRSSSALIGIGAIAAFLVVEHRSSHPMLPLAAVPQPQFSGANGTTLAVYAALGGALFLVVLRAPDRARTTRRSKRARRSCRSRS